MLCASFLSPLDQSAWSRLLSTRMAAHSASLFFGCLRAEVYASLSSLSTVNYPGQGTPALSLPPTLLLGSPTSISGSSPAPQAPWSRPTCFFWFPPPFCSSISSVFYFFYSCFPQPPHKSKSGSLLHWDGGGLPTASSRGIFLQ